DLLKGLKAIKQESFICHGDFHAGNIIARDGRFVAIDWMNCYAGNKEGDLARTYLMLVTPDLPFELGKIQKAILTLYKKALGRVYLNEYLKLSGLKKRRLIKWLPIIAAARLDDNIPSERKWLLKIIRKTIKFLRKR
ncbi:MAG: phosphotransferase, partial [Treponema sp.]|nr:phosphotransferase [Treponema sp.]